MVITAWNVFEFVVVFGPDLTLNADIYSVNLQTRKNFEFVDEQ